MIPIYNSKEEEKIKKMGILDRVMYMEKLDNEPARKKVIRENKIMDKGYGNWLAESFGHATPRK
jgi:hypothetical protein